MSTIHGAKGGEAQSVFLKTDVSLSTHDAMQESMDDETRVFYVAVTRAIERLVVMHGESLMSYPVID